MILSVSFMRRIKGLESQIFSSLMIYKKSWTFYLKSGKAGWEIPTRICQVYRAPHLLAVGVVQLVRFHLVSSSRTQPESRQLEERYTLQVLMNQENPPPYPGPGPIGLYPTFPPKAMGPMWGTPTKDTHSMVGRASLGSLLRPQCVWWKTKEKMTWAHPPASQPGGLLTYQPSPPELRTLPTLPVGVLSWLVTSDCCNKWLALQSPLPSTLWDC